MTVRLKRATWMAAAVLPVATVVDDDRDTVRQIDARPFTAVVRRSSSSSAVLDVRPRHRAIGKSGPGDHRLIRMRALLLRCPIVLGLAGVTSAHR
jgi:hypothetical protein